MTKSVKIIVKIVKTKSDEVFLCKIKSFVVIETDNLFTIIDPVGKKMYR